MKRGDIILAFIPNVGSPGGKKRPALIVQSDLNNARLNEQPSRATSLAFTKHTSC
jgi:mRNA-degrading endonuclease toxin of MazEF toxin-antitoxin module